MPNVDIVVAIIGLIGSCVVALIGNSNILRSRDAVLKDIEIYKQLQFLAPIDDDASYEETQKELYKSIVRRTSKLQDSSGWRLIVSYGLIICAFICFFAKPTNQDQLVDFILLLAAFVLAFIGVALSATIKIREKK